MCPQNGDRSRMGEPDPDRIPVPVRRGSIAALRTCARETGAIPSSKAYGLWLDSIEPLLLLRSYVAQHPGRVPTGTALDQWLASPDRPSTAARWSSASIERAYGSLRRAIAAASRLGPIMAYNPQGQWYPSPSTIAAEYGSWRAALVDAGVIEERR